MSDEKKDLVKDDSPAALIRDAVKGGADLDKLKGLMEIQKEWEANEAKKAYHIAISKFKENPPIIDKDRTVAYGNTKYSHASLANAVKKVTKELSKHGLTASWDMDQNGQVVVTCRITHVMGHSEETKLSAPSDKSGAKNDIQAIGSTVTYLQRYTLLAALGLATYDQDDDGEGATEKIDEDQVNTILDFLNGCGIDAKPFLKYMGVSVVEEIPKRDYNKAIKALEAKRKAGAKK